MLYGSWLKGKGSQINYMSLRVIISKNNIPIRLTEERWLHITIAHPEIDSSKSAFVLDVVKDPDVLFVGDKDEILAVRKKSGKSMWFVVVYKEINREDGFILTAYITSDERWLFKRKVLWNKVL